MDNNNLHNNPHNDEDLPQRPVYKGVPPVQRPARRDNEFAPMNTPPQHPERPDAAPENENNKPSGEGSGFDVTFDFDREYRDVPDNEDEEDYDAPIQRRRSRRTGCIGGAMFMLVIVCVSLVLAALLWLGATDLLGFGKGDASVVVTIPRTFTVDDVADILSEAGLIKYKGLFKFFVKLSDDFEETVTPGTYEVSANYDYRALIKSMSRKSGSRMTTTVTIPEGYTLRQIFNRLEEEGVCPAEELWEAATNSDLSYDFLKDAKKGDRLRLEGFLFPDTYTFWYGESAPNVLQKMLDNFGNRFKTEWYEQAEQMGYTVREIVIIASIIEREAGSASDRPMIASVIYNRLNSENTRRLEIDATINYVIAGTDLPFSTSLDDPYNTYRNEGLPPGPIANPGVASIQAALNPNDTDFFFYALSKAEDRSHKFSKTYEEHVAFVESDEYGG